MATITFTIPNDKLQRVIDGMLEVYPNEEVDENGDPVYTDNQWIKERVRRFVVDTVKRGETVIAKRNAGAGVPSADDTIS